jgi:hypothetical protein
MVGTCGVAVKRERFERADFWLERPRSCKTTRRDTRMVSNTNPTGEVSMSDAEKNTPKPIGDPPTRKQPVRADQGVKAGRPSAPMMDPFTEQATHSAGDGQGANSRRSRIENRTATTVRTKRPCRSRRDFRRFRKPSIRNLTDEQVNCLTVEFNWH